MSKLKLTGKNSTTFFDSPTSVSAHRDAVGKSIEVTFKSLSLLITALFHLLDTFLVTITYIQLVLQTIYILNTKQPKYINLRHMVLKWLSCLILTLFKQGLSQQSDLNSQITILFLDILAIVIAYPSKTLKLIHLKYFSSSEYQDSVEGTRQYETPFASKIFIAVIVGMINFCRYLTAFVLPHHRRPVEDALRAINVAVIDGKCFWTIYDTHANKVKKQMTPSQKMAIRDYLVSGISIPKTYQNFPEHLSDKSTPTQTNNHTQVTSSTGEIIRSHAQQCSSITLKPMKQISIKYTISQSKLEITDMDFGKIQTYILEELSQRQGNILQLTVLRSFQDKSQPIYIKFKNARELDLFTRAIEEAQRKY